MRRCKPGCDTSHRGSAVRGRRRPEGFDPPTRSTPLGGRTDPPPPWRGYRVPSGPACPDTRPTPELPGCRQSGKRTQGPRGNHPAIIRARFPPHGVPSGWHRGGERDFVPPGNQGAPGRSPPPLRPRSRPVVAPEEGAATRPTASSARCEIRALCTSRRPVAGRAGSRRRPGAGRRAGPQTAACPRHLQVYRVEVQVHRGEGRMCAPAILRGSKR